MAKSKQLGVVLIFCSSIFAHPLPSQASGSEANTLFKSSSQPSYQSLSLLIARDRKNATAYYLRGCLLMRASDPRALQDFQWACRLAPKTAIEQYSKIAIARLGQPAKATPIEETAQATDEEADEESATEGSRAKRQDRGDAPNETVALIRRQAQTAHSRAIEGGKINAAEEISKADSQAKSTQERLQRQAMEAALGKYGGEQRFDPYSFISPAQVDSFRAQAATTAERVRDLGKLKATFKEEEGKEKASEIDYQAENLERQLKDNRPLSGIKLNPLGTNLYTRNYALVPPTVKPVKAQALSLPGTAKESKASWRSESQNAQGELENSLTSQSTDAHGNRIKASVKGQLVPSKKDLPKVVKSTANAAANNR